MSIYGYIELIKMPPPDPHGFSIAIEVGMVGVVERYEKGLFIVHFSVGYIWLTDEFVHWLSSDEVLARMEKRRKSTI